MRADAVVAPIRATQLDTEYPSALAPVTQEGPCTMFASPLSAPVLKVVLPHATETTGVEGAVALGTAVAVDARRGSRRCL